MRCSDFECAMHEHFSLVDTTVLELLAHGDEQASASLGLDESVVGHVLGCSECSCSLLQYAEIRGHTDYQEYPCFHLAYYSTSHLSKCLEQDHGVFTIRAHSDPAVSIGIGHCPWCGGECPTSHADFHEVGRIGLAAWRRRSKA